ncbi:MAG: tail fiber domain-containing protein, partial [Emcibacteraceae bacterium]|nr:tail fiber domain-containing protein [Emcibacteraceae bacterium]
MELGQRTSNASDGRYKGVKIVKYSGGSVVDGDLQADRIESRVYYDLDNTSYYLNPAGTSNLNVVNTQSLGVTNIVTNKVVKFNGSILDDSSITDDGTTVSLTTKFQNGSVWINNGTDYNNYNENIRLFNPANSVSVIAFGASGIGGVPTSSVLGYGDRHEVRIGSTWRTRTYGGYFQVNGDARATMFYDSNNTGYYLNPASTSVLNGLNVSSTISGTTNGNVKQLNTSSGNIDDDWGTSFKTFDPIPTGTPPIQSPNIRTINVGENFGRRTQLAFDYASDRAWFRRRHNTTWHPWREFWHDGNDGSGSGLHADLLDGHHASTTRNSANTIPVRDGNGYLNLGWINTTSGNTTNTITDIYVNTNDGYIRKATPAHFRSQITDGVYLPVGSKATDSNLLDGLDSTAYLRDNGWNSNPGQDANTQPGMSSDFSYSNNAPWTGDLIRFGSSGYSLQLSSAYNDTTGRLSFRTRNGDNNTYNPWRQIWHTGNFNPSSYLTTSGKAADSNLLDGIDSGSFLRSNANDSFSGSLSMNTQKALVASNYGYGVYGVYSSTRLQHLWSMGTSYNLDSNGNSSGNLYGIAWSHQNAGTKGGANNLASHGMLILENGVWKGAWGGGSLRTPSDVRAPIFYDLNNTGYYVNPASNSHFNTISTAGAITAAGAVKGDYFVGTNYAAKGYTVYKGYDNWNHYIAIRGYARPGQGKSDAAILGGHQTSLVEYAEAGSATTGWFFMGSQSTNYVQVGKITQSHSEFVGSVRSPIFYDSNDTGRYVNPNGTSSLGSIAMNNGNLTGVNHITINDPGPTEGIQWTGGNGWKIVESPNNLTTNSGGNLQLAIGTSQKFYVDTSGNSYSISSFRAPIFYDSNDTGYYVNPASTSRMSEIDVNNVDIVASAAHGLRFWSGNNSYSIRMSSSTSGTYGGRVGGETTSDYNMYFTMAGGTNRGFVFNNGLNNAIAGIDASGNGRFEGDVIAYSASDKRLKDNIKPIENATDKINKIGGYTFDWNSNQETYKSGTKDIGVIAQEVEEVLPEVVTTRDNGYKAVKYEKLVALLIQSNKELTERIEQLETLI